MYKRNFSPGGLKMVATNFLLNVLDKEKLHEIIDKFTEATGLAAVPAEMEGENIAPPSNFTRHCKMVRSTEAGRKGCYASDARAGRLSLKVGRPVMTFCHCGIVDLATPLVLDGICYGYVLCGQVFLEPPDEKALNEARRRAIRFGLDPDEYVESFLEIKVVPYNRVIAAAETLYLVANYIVEMGASRVAQRKLMEEERKRAELERALRALEFKALKSQVNPHFLFNALNTATRLACLENAKQTEEILYSLANLLHYSLRNLDKLVRLGDEITHVKQYLHIQNVRYKGHIRFALEVPESLEDALLPVMSLQPLVENAVIHGLEQKIEGGEVRIIAYEKGDLVKVEVIDDGVGIEDGVLERLRQERLVDGRRHGLGLGVLNVDSRFKQYFGPSYGLKLESEVGRGTRAILTYPRVFDSTLSLST